MKRVGSVEIPQEAFLAVLRTGRGRLTGDACRSHRVPARRRPHRPARSAAPRRAAVRGRGVRRLGRATATGGAGSGDSRWYALGIALVLLVYWLYPQPISVLHLDLGPDREQALIYGLVVRRRRHRAGRSASRGSATAASACRRPAPTRARIAQQRRDGVHRRGTVPGHHAGPAAPPGAERAGRHRHPGGPLRPRDPAGRQGPQQGRCCSSTWSSAIVGWLASWSRRGHRRRRLGHAITRFAIFLATGHAGQARPAAGSRRRSPAGRCRPRAGTSPDEARRRHPGH